MRVGQRHRYSCNQCNATFSRAFSMRRHVTRFHANRPPVLDCQVCGLVFRSRREFWRHYRGHARDSTFRLRRNAFKGAAKTVSKFHQDERDIMALFGRNEQEITECIENQLNMGVNIKVNILLIVQVLKIDGMSGEVVQTESLPFRARHFVTYQYDNDLLTKIRHSFNQINKHFEDFQTNGSGWILNSVLETKIEFAQAQAINGMCGFSVVKNINDARKVREQLTKDDKEDKGDKTTHRSDCLYRSIAYHFIKTEDLQQLDQFIEKHIHKLQVYKDFFLEGDSTTKTLDTRMPVPHREWLEKPNTFTQVRGVHVSRLNEFMTLNSHCDIRLNVLYLEKDSVYPIFTSKNKSKNCINLLLHKVNHHNRTYHHFSYIDNLDKFLRKTYVSEEGKKTYQKCFVCPNCLQKFSSKEVLATHEESCFNGPPQKVIITKKTLEFTKFNSKFKKPFIGFFDFESNCIPINNSTCLKCEDNKCVHKTVIESTQTPSGYSFIIVDNNEDVLINKFYVGPDPVNHMIGSLMQFYEDVLKHRLERFADPPQLTEQEEQEFQEAEFCHICEKRLWDETGIPDQVRDHCHVTGKYLGAAHDACNLLRVESKTVPMYCHNFSGYDSHLIIKAFDRDLINYQGPVTMKGLPYNSERVRSLTIGRFVLTDSLGFLQGSLSELTDNVHSSGGAFPVLRQLRLYKSKKQKKLLLRKGVFPYDFATSLNKLKETEQLPAKEHFYNRLIDKPISDDDYKHAQTVFLEFKCKNMLEYLKLYMRLDTALLADVFLKFRGFMHGQFKLDPCHFLSLPAYSYQCMLKMTKVALEPIPDIDMFNFLRDNIRGGFSFVAERLAEKQEDPKQTLAYYDANNLYGLAQSCYLPVNDFKWVKSPGKEKLQKLINQYSVDSDKKVKKGFVAEVDLSYPSHLHREHRSFPLAPEQTIVSDLMLSPYQRECHKVLGTRPSKTPKLIGTFYDRKKYVIHAANLKLYQDLGMKITKVHRILRFNESKFLEPYISFCTRMRTSAKNDFEKRMFKLLCNSCFGKFIENTGKYLDMKICRTRVAFQRWTTNPRFVNFVIISENLTLVFLHRTESVLKQACAVGFSILELAKWFMYSKYYEEIKPALGGCEVLMSDTDSIFIKTSNENPHESLGELLDTSNFSKGNALYSSERKSQLGYFKSETGDLEIEKFIGLRSKCYAFRTEKYTESKCKGISKHYKSNLSLETFQKCLNEISSVSTMQRTLNSKAHEIIVKRQNKIAFSSIDNKFYIYPCGIHTCPYGSIEIVENLLKCSICQ